MYIQPFTMGVEWHEIGCLMEVSIIFDTCTLLHFYFVRQRVRKSSCKIYPVNKRLELYDGDITCRYMYGKLLQIKASNTEGKA